MQSLNLPRAVYTGGASNVRNDEFMSGTDFKIWIDSISSDLISFPVLLLVFGSCAVLFVCGVRLLEDAQVVILNARVVVGAVGDATGLGNSQATTFLSSRDF